MIRVKVNKIVGFGLQSFPTEDEILQVAERITRYQGEKKVCLIGLPINERIITLVEKLIAKECIIDGFFSNEKRYETTDLQETLRDMIGENKYHVERRSDFPSAPCLIGENLWKEKEKIKGKVTVLFHYTANGFLGFVKGCGVTYQGMDKDAAFLSGQSGRFKSHELTFFGEFLKCGLRDYCPYLSYDPKRFLSMKIRIFGILALAIQEGVDHEKVQELWELIKEATQQSIDLALDLAIDHTKIIQEDIAYCDQTEFLRDGKKIAFDVWKERCELLFDPMLFASKALHPEHGEAVFVSTCKKNVGNLDIRDFLPQEVEKINKIRATIPMQHWREFLKIWKNK